jgi:hypothetical protein
MLFLCYIHIIPMLYPYYSYIIVCSNDVIDTSPGKRIRACHVHRFQPGRTV